MRSAVLAILLSLVLAAPAAADRFILRYDGAGLGFIPLGNVVVDADVEQDSYFVTVSLRSGGLLSLFERTNIEASAEGTITGNVVRWRQYNLDHHYSRKHRTIAMTAGDDGAVTAQITPNYRIWGDPPASDAQRRGAQDPLSTMVAMSIDAAATRRCYGDYPTFDGRFYYLMQLSGGRVTRFAGGGYYGEVLRCNVTYIPLAGYERRDAGRRRIPHGEVWFALAPGARFAPPVHISTPFSAGSAVIRLNNWRRIAVTVYEPDQIQAPAP
jgi:hypothetical protein